MLKTPSIFLGILLESDHPSFDSYPWDSGLIYSTVNLGHCETQRPSWPQPSQIWDLDYRIKNLSAIVYFPWDDHKASETQHMSSSSYSPKHDASLLCKSGTLLSSNCGILVNSLSIPTSSQTQHPDTSSLSFHLSSPFLLLCFVVFLLP